MREGMERSSRLVSGNPSPSEAIGLLRSLDLVGCANLITELEATLARVRELPDEWRTVDIQWQTVKTAFNMAADELEQAIAGESGC